MTIFSSLQHDRTFLSTGHSHSSGPPPASASSLRGNHRARLQPPPVPPRPPRPPVPPRRAPASRRHTACDWLLALPVSRGERVALRPALLLVTAARQRADPPRRGKAGGGRGGGTGGGCRFRNRRSSSPSRGLRGLGRVGPRRAGPLGVEAAWGRAGRPEVQVRRPRVLTRRGRGRRPRWSPPLA